MQVTNSGSVRVDIVGGTLDISPIHLILPNVVTINVATELKAKVVVQTINEKKIKIISKDYGQVYQYELFELTTENFLSGKFNEMSFVLQIIDYFKPEIGLEVSLESGAPAGSGLGGSSAMGVTLYKALADFFGYPFERIKAIKVVQSIESKILNQGVPGYQDYYPALFGGVLALKPNYDEVKVEQHYSEKLAKFLKENTTLVYSGISRQSGINNWEVYKSFFDKNQATRKGMADIARVSHEAYLALQKEDFVALKNCIGLEGMFREKLFPNIVSPEIAKVFEAIKSQISDVGLKMCGAGGGGCFLLTHRPEDREIIEKALKNHNMRVLDFSISSPIS